MRRFTDKAMGAVMGICAFICMAILIGLVGVVAQRGGPALSWSFFTEQIRLVGAAGGILWNLIGTTILLVSAFLICAPFAIALALLERVWLPSDHARRTMRTLLYTLNGLPSILFGLFGFIVFVQ